MPEQSKSPSKRRPRINHEISHLEVDQIIVAMRLLRISEVRDKLLRLDTVKFNIIKQFYTKDE